MCTLYTPFFASWQQRPTERKQPRQRPTPSSSQSENARKRRHTSGGLNVFSASRIVIAKHKVVALLHAATARDLYDKELIQIIGTLSTQSEEFRSLWASHDVFRYRSGANMLSHSPVGDLEFGYESFELSTNPALVMLVYTVEPGSATADAMRILASWTAPAINVH